MPEQTRNNDRDFDEALRLMRRHSPLAFEDGFHLLQRRAAEHIDRLLQAFADEVDPGLRYALLELIGDAASPKAMETLSQQLRSDDESFRYWAIQGLARLGTKEARTLLWEAQSWQLATPDETASFHQQLREMTAQARARDDVRGLLNLEDLRRAARHDC